MGRITPAGRRSGRRVPDRAVGPARTRQGRAPVTPGHAHRGSTHGSGRRLRPDPPPRSVAHPPPAAGRHLGRHRRGLSHRLACSSGCATATATASPPRGRCCWWPTTSRCSIHGLRPAGLRQRPDPALPGQGVAVHRPPRDVAPGRRDISVARYTSHAKGSVSAAQRAPVGEPGGRYLPGGLGHPRPGLVADAGADGGGAAGSHHRRRRRPGGPVGAAGAARLPHQEVAPARARPG